MDGKEKLVQAEEQLAKLAAEKAAVERVLGVALEVITDAQWGEIRARLDAQDAEAVQ
jgi:hypothetical protein